MGQGEPVKQAIAIMMEAHWRSAVHPDRVEGIARSTKTASPTSPIPITNAPHATR
jgi:enoyl-CoA hydratase